MVSLFVLSDPVYLTLSHSTKGEDGFTALYCLKSALHASIACLAGGGKSFLGLSSPEVQLGAQKVENLED